MTVPNPIKFLIKIWLTTVILAPFLFQISSISYQYFKYDILSVNIKEVALVTGFLILIGFLLSIPTFFLMMLLIFRIDTIRSVLLKKFLIALLSLSLVSLTLWIAFKGDIINHSENNIQLILLSAPYIVVSFTATFIYVLKGNS